MKTEKPILFSGPMVIKTIEGIKTVTRRIVKPQPPDYIDYFEYSESGFFRPYIVMGEACAYPNVPAKYAPGHWLWCRETWGINGYSNESGYEICVKYKADRKESNWIDLDNEELWEKYVKQERKYIFKNCGYNGPACIDGQSGCSECKHFKGKDSILWRPSIFLPRAAARITLDVKKVNIERLHELDDCEARLEGFDNREDFIKYWNQLNEKRGYPWKNNPWVYRIEYERVKNG